MRLLDEMSVACLSRRMNNDLTNTEKFNTIHGRNGRGKEVSSRYYCYSYGA